MIRRFMPLHLLTLLAAAVCIAADEPANESPESPPPSAEAIDRWVKELNSDEFVERELATERLIKAGRDAIGPVAASIPGGSLEVAVRGVYILRELALDGNLDTEEEARRSLEIIARARTTAAARRASATLAVLDEVRQSRSIEALEELGAVVSTGQTQIGLQIVTSAVAIEINDEFKGDDDDLRLLRWLVNVEKLTFDGTKIHDASFMHVGEMKSLKQISVKRAKITDEALGRLAGLEELRYIDVMYSPVTDKAVEHLMKQKSAQSIKLYGTEMTREAADKLQAGLVGVTVDYRKGAFLGVGCQNHPLGCAVSIIQPDSAAARAGLTTGDVIAKYNGEKVATFDDLTRLIGGNVVGDTITLDIVRGTEEMKKEIKLGEWD